MIVNIQSLRALAAMLVVIVHCELLLNTIGDFHYVVVAASSGVDLFFVISGFIMVYSSSLNKPTPQDFFANRVARVAPLYWLLTLGVFAIALLKPQLLSGTKASLEHLLKSLLFIPYARDDGRIAPIFFLGWTLNYEMMFYMIFSFALLSSDIAKTVLISCLILIILVTVGYISEPSNVVASFYTRPILLEFGMGMLIGRFYKIIPGDKSSVRIAAIAFCISAVMMMYSTSIAIAMFPITGIPAAILVISMLVMDKGGVSITWPPLVKLGNASYSLYLVHPFIAQAISKIAIQHNIHSQIQVIIVIITIYVISILVATVSFRYLEIPMTTITRRILNISQDKNQNRTSRNS